MKSASVQKIESERSYDQLSARINLDNKFLDIENSLGWQFILTVANLLLYQIDTYTICFNTNFRKISGVLWIVYICDVLILYEIIASALMRYNYKIRSKSLYESGNKFYFFFELVSAYTILVDIFNIEYRPALYIKYLLVFARNYRMIFYYGKAFQRHITASQLRFFSKYIPIFGFITHTFTCIWYISCSGCSFTEHPKNTFYELGEMLRLRARLYREFGEGHRASPDPNPSETYLFCYYYVIGSFTKVGFGHPSPMNDTEQLLTVLIILTTFLFKMVVLGDLTAVMKHWYGNQILFSSRLRLINKYLWDERFAPRIREKTIAYYISYWEKQSAMDSCTFLNILPPALVSDINLDTYWFAINQTSLFQNHSLTLKRQLAMTMVTQYYNKDDIILEQGGSNSDLFFIARGSVNILSEEDGESPLLSLGVGTTFGDLCLFYSWRCRFSVVASTYCIMHVLRKQDFWRQRKILCLKMSKVMGDELKQRIKHARNDISTRRDDVKPLIKMKNALSNSVQLSIYDERNQWQPFSNLYDSYVLDIKSAHTGNDGLFFITKWPWKLRDNSSYIFIWECFIIAVVCFMLVIWPIKIFLQNDYDDPTLMMCKYHFWIFFMFDVLIQSFTVVETPNGTQYKLDDIFNHRWMTLVFIFDVLAAVPFDLFVRVLSAREWDKRFYHIVALSAFLLKLKRIPLFLKKLESRYLLMNVTSLRMFGYCFFLASITYISGCGYFLIMCFNGNDDCVPFTWFKRKLIYKEQYANLLYVLHFTLAILTETAIADISTITEIFCNIFLALLSSYLMNYFASDYAACYELTHQLYKKFCHNMYDLDLYMRAHGISSNMKARVHYNLTNTWDYDKGLRNMGLFYDLPQDLYKSQQIAYYMQACKEVPLFQGISNELLKVIALKCTTVFIPPGDIIIYGGVLVDDMYIIDKGYCEVLSPITGKLKKMLGPRMGVNCIEALLTKANSNDVRTLTHMTLIKIEMIDLKYAFALDPCIQNLLDDLIESTLEFLKDDVRIFAIKKKTGLNYLDMHSKKSWVVFPKKSKDPRYTDLKNNFNSENLFWVLQYIVLRRTILPNGRFIYIWEIIRFLLTWWLCICNPIGIIYDHKYRMFEYVDIAIHVFLLLDMYLQLHVCYYNKKGLLVSHPNYTAQNYIKSRLLLEFLGFIPTNILVTYVFQVDDFNLSTKYQIVLLLNKFLLLSRSRCIIYNEQIGGKGVTLKLIIYLSFIIVALYNAMAAILCLMNVNFSLIGDNDELQIDPIPGSSLDTGAEMYGTMEEYVQLLQWITNKFLNIGFDASNSYILLPIEMYYDILMCFCGYFLFGFLCVMIGSRFSISTNVTKYHAYMYNLKKFMKKEKISKQTLKSTMAHFDYLWDMTQGVPNTICNITSTTIKQDFALIIYGTTLGKSIPFSGTNPSFRRRLGVHFTEEYYTHKSTIIAKNDVIRTFFMVHKGNVNVLDATGKIMETMGKGSIFGNFDCVKMTRSMVTIVAMQNVVVIKMKTSQLYAQLEEEPAIVRIIQNHIVNNNQSFIKCKPDIKKMYKIKSRFLRLVRSIMSSNYLIVFDILNVMVTFYVTTHYMVFGKKIYAMFIHVTDFVILLKICLDFLNPAFGKPVSKTKKIKIKLKSISLLIDISSVLPLDFLTRFSTTERHDFLNRIMHFNKLFRMFHLFRYFHLMDLRRNKHVVLIKMSAIICIAVIVVHSAACLFYITACWKDNCLLSSWVYTGEGQKVCDSIYLCSLTYATSVLFGRGYQTLRPRSLVDCVMMFTYSTMFKFLMAAFVGNAIAIAGHLRLEIRKHVNVAGKLHESLLRNNISPILTARAHAYTDNLWSKARGKQMPRLVMKGANHITEAIKMEAFGKHITNNIVFDQCHPDFVRQLVGYMQLRHYFCDDIICHEGQIDDTMYFIHLGNVEVVLPDSTEDVSVDALEKNDCFGIVQGLFPCSKHLFTYKAANVVEILSLNFHDWCHLLEFFPATKFSLYDTLAIIYHKREKHISETSFRLGQEDVMRSNITVHTIEV